MTKNILITADLSSKFATESASFFKREPKLAWLTVLVLCFIPPLLLLHYQDTRLLNGISVWHKPLKFHLAIAVFCGTLAWYCAWINRAVMSRWWYRLYINGLVIAVVVELAWLWFAAALGEPSHFNRTHSILAVAYPLMGIIAVYLTSATLFVAVLLQANKHSPLTRYCRSMTISGLLISFVFTVFIASELASMDSHWIGGSQTDTNGFWLFGRSRDGGDLRVAHFFSLHAMQALPLIALLPVWGRAVTRSGWLTVFWSGCYAALILFTYFQAKRGLPFLPFLAA